MANVKSKVIVIMGPTASGKSDAAIKLAKRFNGEIISADSRQVYKGMDIGTGKVLKDLVRISNFVSVADSFQFPISNKNEVYISEGIPHYLIDVAEPNEEFNVSHFKKATEQAIEKILAKGKVPIICGGTGFWIQAVVDDVVLPNVKPNAVLRNMLRNKSAEELFNELKKLDPVRAENIDPHNHVRLIRAIEIAKELGKVPVLKKNCHPEFISGSSQEEILKQVQNDNWDFLQIGIEVTREVLNEKIKKRLDARFKEGMIEEVENLHKNGVSWERMEAFGLEYRWISRFLQKQIDEQEMREKLYYDIIHYAKRQMTWFGRNKKIIWKNNYQDIETEVQNFLERK